MNNEEVAFNRKLWFMAGDGWREMACPVVKRKLVVLVPQPDDEIFGSAGLLRKWAKEASEILIVYVTLGEAAHSFQATDEKAEAAWARRQTSQKALAEEDLGTPISIQEFQLPDAQAKGCTETLMDYLRLELDSNSIVVAPYYDDGHSNHNTVGACARELAEEIGFEIHFYPIWLWAIDCFDSERIPRAGREAVIPEEFLHHYKKISFEALVN